MLNSKSIDEDTPVRPINDVRNMDMSKDQLDRVLQIIDSGLNALTPTVGSAREFTDCEREVCKLGLNISKLMFQHLDSLRIIHNIPIDL